MATISSFSSPDLHALTLKDQRDPHSFNPSPPSTPAALQWRRAAADMDRTAWMLVPLLAVFPLVVGTDLENVAGRLVFYQTEGNDTYVRDTGELASDVPTETMFELLDPQKNFSSADVTYTWDLGNGKVIEGTSPVVRYQYSKSGNYTLQLRVGANKAKYTPQVSSVYSLDVQVLDVIKNIKLKGATDYQVSQSSSLALDVDGSPPMWACWHILTHCNPDMATGCTLAMLYGHTLHVNHTFTSTGSHCLDISVRNNVSKLQTSFNLNVGRSAKSHPFFILLCAAVLVATLSFILVAACRPRPSNGSQVPSSSNAMFMKDIESGSPTKVRFDSPAVAQGEKEPLIMQYGTQ